jgi:uncharacterized repeat protein (TIGR01451 family)
MRYFAVLVMVFMCAGVASAANISKNDIEWGDAASATLYMGDTLMNGDYTVKAVEFSSPVPGIKNLQGNIVPDAVVVPMVNLEIYKSGVLINKIVMKLADEPYIDADYEYRISVTEFPNRNSREWVYEYYKPWATVSIQTKAKPELEVDIITDKTSYNSYNDTQIDAKVMVINKGGAFAKNVDVNLSPGELKLGSGDIRQLHKNFQRIEKNSVQSFMVTLAVPQITDEESYALNADAMGYDILDNEYTASGSLSLTVTPKSDYFTISKSARDRIYLGDNDTVHLVVSNRGAYDIRDISLQDSINENFALEQNSSLQWDIPLLKPGQDWETTYTIQPLKTNLDGFQIPEATARFTVNDESVKASSEKTTIIVNGPIIILNKTVDMDVAYINEDVKVTVSVNNVGNIPTKVEVKDSLPQGVSFVSGQTSLDPTFLELNAPQEFSYIIRRSTEGEVRLSPAVANYTDIMYRGETRSEILSDRPVITFIDTSKAKPTPAATEASNLSANKTRTGSQKQDNLAASVQPTPMTPGFAGIIAIITLLLAGRRKRS